MKTLLSYQTFSEQKNKGFVQVPTTKDRSKWRDLLFNYRYLHSIGVVITKANRKYVFNTLEKLKVAQSELIQAIDNDESVEVKENLKEVILNLQKLLSDLSVIRDEEKEETKEETTPFTPSMIYFDKKIETQDGETIYITKGGKRFRVKDKSNEEKHISLTSKCSDAVELRVKEKKEAKKQADKEEKQEANISKPLTKEVKTKINKVADSVKDEAKRLEKREAMKIGVESTKGDKFVERVFEKKRLF